MERGCRLFPGIRGKFNTTASRPARAPAPSFPYRKLFRRREGGRRELTRPFHLPPQPGQLCRQRLLCRRQALHALVERL